MSGLGSKTAVSYLQEYLVSKKMVPYYELIHDGVGSHAPEFTYRVQASGLSEEGTGKSKQEAKHRAAEKMLIKLQLISGKAAQEETDELDQELLDNYVGQLKELCESLHYPKPLYNVEEEGGPPHSKIFKMACSVSQLQEFGIDKTKKRAKQRAAFHMIQRLKEVGGKKTEEALAHPASPSRNKPASAVTDEEIVKKYSDLTSSGVPVEPIQSSAFYKDHYKAYIGLQENSPTLTNILNNSTIITLENSPSLVQRIARELGVALTKTMVPCMGEGEYTVMTMSVTPPVGDVGFSEASAAFSLLHTLVCLCTNT